jgi:hypothetical protein
MWAASAAFSKSVLWAWPEEMVWVWVSQMMFMARSIIRLCRYK